MVITRIALLCFACGLMCSMQTLGPNGMVARHDLVGIYATKASRRPRDVPGERLHVQVRVVDKRAVFAPNGTLMQHKGGPYNISAVLKVRSLTHLHMAPHRCIGPGCVTVRTTGSYDRHSLRYVPLRAWLLSSQGVGVKEMGSGPQPVIGVADTIEGPGLFTLEVRD